MVSSHVGSSVFIFFFRLLNRVDVALAFVHPKHWIGCAKLAFVSWAHTRRVQILKAQWQWWRW